MKIKFSNILVAGITPKKLKRDISIENFSKNEKEKLKGWKQLLK